VQAHHSACAGALTRTDATDRAIIFIIAFSNHHEIEKSLHTFNIKSEKPGAVNMPIPAQWRKKKHSPAPGRVAGGDGLGRSWTACQAALA
jgi:hypothetical protein